jgi:hypothetical protein
MELGMEREWFATVRLMQAEIGVVVAVALMALLAITARLARDPSEPAVRWFLDRARIAGPVAQDPVQPAAQPAVQAAAAEPESGTEHQHASPEWLDRLLGRPQQLARPAGDPQDQPGPRSGRRVA